MTSMTSPSSLGPSKKKRKLLDTDNVLSIASSQGPKSSPSYPALLRRLGIFDEKEAGTIPPLSRQNSIRQYFPEPRDIPLVSSLLKSWFSKCEPNEATLVQKYCQHVFPWNIHISDESHILLLLEFLGPFRGHNIDELLKGDEAIKYPLIKCDPSQEKLERLLTPASDDLRSHSDFVFAASIMILDETTREIAQLATTPDFRLPCLSNDLQSCAVAIVAEAKATASPASRNLAKIQWSSVAYLQIMDRISIARRAPYADDKNMCQYGYIICGLSIIVWKMSLRLNIVEPSQSDVLSEYFTFPIQCLGYFNIGICTQLEKFVKLHKELLSWWKNDYIPSFVNDVTNIISAHPNECQKWKSS